MIQPRRLRPTWCGARLIAFITKITTQRRLSRLRQQQPRTAPQLPQPLTLAISNTTTSKPRQRTRTRELTTKKNTPSNQAHGKSTTAHGKVTTNNTMNATMRERCIKSSSLLRMSGRKTALKSSRQHQMKRCTTYATNFASKSKQKPPQCARVDILSQPWRRFVSWCYFYFCSITASSLPTSLPMLVRAIWIPQH